MKTNHSDKDKAQEAAGATTFLDMTKTELNNTELKKYRNMLEAKHAELEQFIRKREGIAIEKSPDTLDEVQRASERELAIRNLDRESNLLRNVRAALRRIDDGSYGVCLHCEDDINPKRLNAIPWAPFCIQCQEQYDKNRAEMTEGNMDELLLNAA
jgi:DnaK suppressor protein